MHHLNIEFKARCAELEPIRSSLKRLGARGPTPDHQIDTYFKARHGRLKLREGTVERALIHFERTEKPGLKRSDVTLYPTGEETEALKEVLTRALGLEIVVEKHREIWWLDNVKIHVDEVAGLGNFVEIEAIAQTGLTESDLRDQCHELMQALGIQPNSLLSGSYGDMLA